MIDKGKKNKKKESHHKIKWKNLKLSLFLLIKSSNKMKLDKRREGG